MTDQQDTFSLEVTVENIVKFLESENMKIKKIKLTPASNSQQTGIVEAIFTAYIIEKTRPKPFDFKAIYNNSQFSFFPLSKGPITDEVNLDREWQRYMYKHLFGKRYLDYHEKRLDGEINKIELNREEILKQKAKELDYIIARLKDEKTL